MTVLGSLTDAADVRSGMPGHCKRVAALVAPTLKALGVTGKDAQLILDAARLHDIGKLAVPEAALVRSRRLTPLEWSWVRHHTDRGAAYLRAQPGAQRTAEIVLHHHERFDGDGYPGHMCGERIPLGSRIIAIAECFDALTHESPFHPALPVRAAIEALAEGAGQQWDGSFVETFLHTAVPEMQQEELCMA